MTEDKLQKISRYLFYAITLFLLLWLSFFIEPVDSKYGRLITIILFAALSFIIFANRTAARAAFSDKADIFLWAHLLMVTAGILFVQNRPIALNFYFRYILPIPIVYYLFKAGFPLLKRKDWFFLIIASFAGLVALFAILEYIFRKNPVYEYFFENVYYKYYLFNKHRPMATQLVPQVLGVYLAVCMPIVYYFIFASRNRGRRIFWIIWAVPILIGIIVAQRGAVVCFVLSSFFYFGMKNRKVLLGLCIATLIFFILFSFARIGPLRRLGIEGFTEKAIYGNRIQRMITAVEMVRDHPVVGLGLNHYKIFFDKYYQSQLTYLLKTPENMFLMILCETGIFSFVFFLLFLALILKRAFIRVKLKLANHEIVLALLSGMVAILVGMIEYDALYWTVPFYLFWIYCGILQSYSLSLPLTKPSLRRRD
ncbi:MAG: O-antigen ligase family protein [Candidatus Omnitrophota bacterium]|jgi:O-antigen ligase